MSESLDREAELLKLARLVGRDPTDLTPLAEVPAAALRALREQATDVLFASAAKRLRRISTASKLLPVALLALIAKKVFGPLLAARVAGLIEPARAVEIAAKLPTPFLAEVATHLDPRRARAVIAALAPDRVAAVASELVTAKEHVTLGRFVGYLDRAQLEACLAVIDDASILRIAFVLEAKDRLDELATLLPPARLSGLIRAAAAHDLWAEALGLFDHLGPERQRALAALVGEEPDDILSSLIEAAQRRTFWDSVLPLTHLLSDAHRRRFATATAMSAETIIETIVTVAAHHHLWSDLAPLVPSLSPSLQRRIIGTALDLAAQRLRTVLSQPPTQHERERAEMPARSE
jgi:hypothetical protein